MRPLKSCFLLLVAMTASCSNGHQDVVYSTFQSVDNKGWEENMPVEFALSSMSDSLYVKQGKYDVVVMVRHNLNYKYHSIRLVAQSIGLTQEERSDTITISVATPDGRWVGDGMRTLRMVTDTIARGVNIDSSWQLSIKQDMGINALDNVTDVGIKLLKSKR